ncbi:MAG TPA: outer membrane porin, OprD family, partial [Epsilonproteobacteria bacterium]|nr:outer membrane porin, OprD family [Campylobacterota bacterium]
MFIKSILVLVCSSLLVHANTLENHESNTTKHIKVTTVRGILGSNDPLLHTRGQIRIGYINFKEDGAASTHGYGLAGHVHFDTQRWHGLSVGLSAYGVLNLATNQNPLNVNPDFFDADGDSFAQLTEAYLDGKWGETEVKLGRQMLDTPHADSDDIRMIPNYFEAYTITDNSIKDLTLSAGIITKMAGWENGVDAQKFVKIGEALGISNIDGVVYASISYEGIKDVSFSLWYYNYQDIADVLYSEVGYEKTFNAYSSLTLGLQYDGSQESGAAKLGTQDAQTYGISMELASEAIGVHILAAYNKDTGSTGASSLNLGGGALFTSMEDQTLDAVGMAGEAWIIGT